MDYQQILILTQVVYKEFFHKNGRPTSEQWGQIMEDVKRLIKASNQISKDLNAK